MANFLDLTTGLPALWAKIKSKFYTKAEVDALIPEDEVMWVTITSNSTEYIADKTPTEIYNHVSNGGVAFAKYAGNTYTLGSFNREESVFLFTTMQYDGVGECYIIYIEESYVDVYTYVIAPSNINPLMDGTATYGSSTNYARADHVHPTDTSRVAVNQGTANAGKVLTVGSDGNVATSDLPNEVVVVTITRPTVNDETVYTADKTYSELREASIAGKNIILKYSIYTFYLWSAPKTSSATTQFVFGTLIGGNEFYFTIDSNDVVSRPTLQSVHSVNGNTGAVSLGISDMNDATISNPINNQILTYDSTSSKWVNSTPESDVMVVNITYDSNSSAFVADKTYTETETAWSAGKIVYAKDDSGHSCVYNGAYFEGTYHDEDFARRIEYYYNYNSNYELDYAEPPIVEQHWISSYYLNKYNTTSYTPTSDYNPATKKYVDDSIPAPDIFWVNIEYTSGSDDQVIYTADKSYGEVSDAINSGKYVVANYGGQIYYWDGYYYTSFVNDENSYYLRYFYYIYATNEDNTLHASVYNWADVSSVENKAYVWDVLTKTNTTSYTPTGDYNPATKKYVDDSIPSASTTTPLMDGTASYGSGTSYARANHRHPSDTNKENKAVIVSVTISGSTATVGSPLTAEYMYENFGKRDIYLRDNYRGDIYSLVNYDYDEDEGGVLSVFISKDSSTLGGGDNYTVKVVELGYTDEESDSTWVGDYYEYKNVSISDVLTKTNTTSYTPSANYHPATKKYVDDSIGGISTNLAGLTDTTISSPTDGQVLTYDSTTSKWINSTLSSGITETRVNELIAAALAQYGDGDTASYGYTDASEEEY